MGPDHRGRASGRRLPPLTNPRAHVRTRDALVAGAVAAAFSGAPSTAWNLATGQSILASTEAAGTLLLGADSLLVRGDASRYRLLAAGVAAHIPISLWWAQVLVRVLPRRHTVIAGTAAGAAIAALDLGLISRHYPAIRALPRAPQVLDHLAYGALVGAVLSHLRQDANL